MANNIKQQLEKQIRNLIISKHSIILSIKDTNIEVPEIITDRLINKYGSDYDKMIKEIKVNNGAACINQ